MLGVSPRWPAFSMVLIFIISSGAPVIAQGVGLPDASIHIDWLDEDGDGEIDRQEFEKLGEYIVEQFVMLKVSYFFNKKKPLDCLILILELNFLIFP